jgi:predicted PurR-regulated permease PerM
MELPIVVFIAATVIAIFGFFVRTAYHNIVEQLKELTDLTHKHTEEQGRLKGKLELLEQEHRLKYQLIQETTQQEIRTMATKIGDLSDMVGELVKVQLKVK